MAKNHYEVIISNVGRVYDGHSKIEANATYRSYCFDSRTGYGRAAGEIVDFYMNGEVEKTFDPNEKPEKKVKPKPINLPDELWVMAFHTCNTLGSISHVSAGEKFFTSKEACQKEIDDMTPWPGMGDRNKYRPLQLVKG